MASSQKGDSLREKISETAFRRFLTQGYEEVRIKDVAEECGISNSLLQHYFPKRADLVIDPFFELIMDTFRMVSGQLGTVTREVDDRDLVCVSAFYRTLYTILHADNDRLLKLYTVILYDAVSLKRGTDMVLDNRGNLFWQGNSYKSILGSYAINGIMAQFVVVYFDNRLSNDLMSFVNMALEMDYDLLELSEERRTFVREKTQEVFESEQTQAFIRDYLAYVESLTA